MPIPNKSLERTRPRSGRAAQFYRWAGGPMGFLRSNFVLVTLALIVSLGVYNAVYDTIIGPTSSDWPHVPGIITRSELRQVGDFGLDGFIDYDYSVKGISYTSSKISFGLIDMVEAVKMYPKMKVIPVYYDPQEPSLSVLIPGLNPRIYFTWPLASLSVVSFFILGLLIRGRFLNAQQATDRGLRKSVRSQ